MSESAEARVAPAPFGAISISFTSLPRASISFRRGFQELPFPSKSCKKFPRIGTYQWVTRRSGPKSNSQAAAERLSAAFRGAPRAPRTKFRAQAISKAWLLLCATLQRPSRTPEAGRDTPSSRAEKTRPASAISAPVLSVFRRLRSFSVPVCASEQPGAAAPERDTLRIIVMNLASSMRPRSHTRSARPDCLAEMSITENLHLSQDISQKHNTLRQGGGERQSAEPQR